MIAQEDVFARQRASLERDVDVLGQPDNRRRMNGQFFRVQHVAIMLFNPGHTFKDHHHCAPFIAHIDGLKRGIQD